MRNMGEKVGWTVAGVLALLVVAAMTGVVSGGPLDPPGSPASTQQNLIFQPASCAGFPIVLGTPGSYKLAQNITGCSGKDGIDISASDVSLDLNGFSVLGVPGSFGGVSASVVQRISLSNGHVAGWSGDGAYFGNASESQITHLVVSYNASSGIIFGDNSTLTDCVVSHNEDGVLMQGSGSVVSGCDATYNNAYGFSVSGGDNKLVGNHAVGNVGGFNLPGINVDVEGNSATNNTLQGNANAFGFDVSFGTGTTLTKNTARNNGASNYRTDGCVGCDIGPIGTAASATSPWANISDAAAPQTITFAAISNHQSTDFPLTLTTPTSRSGLTVILASTTVLVCTVSGSVVTRVSPGTCSLAASQLGNGSYAAAADVTRSFAITS